MVHGSNPEAACGKLGFGGGNKGGILCDHLKGKEVHMAVEK